MKEFYAKLFVKLYDRLCGGVYVSLFDFMRHCMLNCVSNCMTNFTRVCVKIVNVKFLSILWWIDCTMTAIKLTIIALKQKKHQQKKNAKYTNQL